MARMRPLPRWRSVCAGVLVEVMAVQLYALATKTATLRMAQPFAAICDKHRDSGAKIG